MVIFCFSIGSEFIEIISTFLSFLGVNYKKIDSNRKIQKRCDITQTMQA